MENISGKVNFIFSIFILIFLVTLTVLHSVVAKRAPKENIHSLTTAIISGISLVLYVITSYIQTTTNKQLKEEIKSYNTTAAAVNAANANFNDVDATNNANDNVYSRYQTPGATEKVRNLYGSIKKNIVGRSSDVVAV